MDQRSEQFLENYLNSFAPVGLEKEGQKVWMDYMANYVDDWFTDAYGTAVGVVNPGHPFKVVIEAHADEISWMVNHISENGLISVIKNGGSDPLIAPAKRVQLHSDKGIVRGVFGWPAIHTRKGNSREAAPTLEKLFIDVGAENKEEVLEMGIHVGTIAVFDDQLEKLNNKFWTGRALDNRMGGVIIAEVAKRLRENGDKLPFTLYVVNAVQEEVGLRGAQMIAERLNPNLAIITDVTHHTGTPMIDEKKEGNVVCGKGPSITIAPSVHRVLLNKILETAKEKEIPFQYEAASRSTGTDTDAFAYSNMGVPSALISLPIKYMHTTVEMAHQEDISNCIALIYNTLLNISPTDKFHYL